MARREITLRERVSSREVLVLGSVLGPAKADAGRRQELETILFGE
jgi:hypothetical protein